MEGARHILPHVRGERVAVRDQRLEIDAPAREPSEHQIAQAMAEYKDWGADEISLGPAIMPLEQYNDGFEPSTIPAYNMYHPENMVQIESARQLQDDRACTWLYGALVLNPNGKVSPCCAVPSEQHDFGSFAPGDKFFDVWNNDKFKRARRLFVEWAKLPAATAKDDTGNGSGDHLVDGMSVMGARALTDKELICQKCPIPYLQNYTDPIVAEVVQDTIQGIFKGDSVGTRVRSLLHYLLMGAPAIGSLAQRGKNSLVWRLSSRSSARPSDPARRKAA